jgi:uncharacterized protein
MLADYCSQIYASEFVCLIVPGWQGSGHEHWQTLWERKYRKFRRVDQNEWLRPRPHEWIQGIAGALEAAGKPVVFIAHSLGCVAVALWSEARREWAQHVAGALLVAPPDLDAATALTEPFHTFGPTPRGTFPFPSTLVASENDPYMSLLAARNLAQNWGSRFVNAGQMGHINCAAGFGPWPQGEEYLADLLSVAAPVRRGVVYA